LANSIADAWRSLLPKLEACSTQWILESELLFTIFILRNARTKLLLCKNLCWTSYGTFANFCFLYKFEIKWGAN
jgi:hypothetical protein